MSQVPRQVARRSYSNTTHGLDAEVAPPVRVPTCDHDAWQPTRQACHCCGVQDHIDFRVPDAVWFAVVPPALSTVAVCLRCFDAFAAKLDIAYAHTIERVDFVGDRATITFTVARSIERATQL